MADVVSDGEAPWLRPSVPDPIKERVRAELDRVGASYRKTGAGQSREPASVHRYARKTYAASPVIVLTVTLVTGERRDVEASFESLDEALKAVENGQAPFSRHWIQTADGGLVRTSSIVAVDLAKGGAGIVMDYGGRKGDDEDQDVDKD